MNQRRHRNFNLFRGKMKIVRAFTQQFNNSLITIRLLLNGIKPDFIVAI